MIGNDTLVLFADHLDAIGDVPKITLYLYTKGGDTLSAWSLVNLIRNFCKELEVIVPFVCHSAGTLICLGANNVIMTKQATLGSIDPNITTPYNPSAQWLPPHVKLPVSVEHVNKYLEIARKELKIRNKNSLANILIDLSNKIHPITLGAVYKSRSQIQMLARKLLKYQNIKGFKTRRIINFLCSESGSHDYTIYRNEARDSLGLNINKPSDNEYTLIRKIYVDIQDELQLLSPFNPAIDLGNENQKNYSYRRCIIESLYGNCDVFMSEGTLDRLPKPTPMPGQPLLLQHNIRDTRTFEGWRHEEF
jgi:ribosomal protein L33